MSYLTDHRATIREDVRNLLPSAQSVICVAKLYNGPEPYSTAFSDTERGWIARYAWGEDYHHTMRSGLLSLVTRLQLLAGEFEWKICVDSAPLLERSLARDAGLGWIGKNTCLINQERGSWFFLGELITSLALEPNSQVPEDRCGTCMRCIESCPTRAIIPAPEGRFEIDSRLCISYLTIELRGVIDPNLRTAMHNQIFGCDICQDVCPWNRRAAVGAEWKPSVDFVAPPLERMAALTEPEFRAIFRTTPVERARYRGFLRNVAVAMGNSRSLKMLEPLGKLANSDDPLIAEHARWALGNLSRNLTEQPEPGPTC